MTREKLENYRTEKLYQGGMAGDFFLEQRFLSRRKQKFLGKVGKKKA